MAYVLRRPEHGPAEQGVFQLYWPIHSRVDSSNAILTWATHWLELLVPVGLFFPWKTAYFRAATVLLLVSLHVGIEITMNVGLFSYVCFAGLILFVPPQVLDRLRKTPTISPAPIFRLESKPPRIISAVLLAVVLLYNLKTVNYPGTYTVVELISVPSKLIGINQSWHMFSPTPPNHYRYLVAEGEKRNGAKVELLSGCDYTPECLEKFSVYYPGWRWREYFTKISLKDFRYLRPYLCDYLLRNWNQNYPLNSQERITSMTIYTVSNPTTLRAKRKVEVLSYSESRKQSSPPPPSARNL